MELSLFDLHCDTAYEMYKTKQTFESNMLAVSLDKADIYSSYTQNFAIWSDKELSNSEAFIEFDRIRRDLQKKLSATKKASGFDYILSVEDARLLDNDISRLDYLHWCGVKILTLLWGGTTCIGGAYDTSVGLTEFGKQIVRRCFTLGIVPDISHSSPKSALDVFELSEYKHPVIATHSDSYTVNPHPRNLTDREFLDIVKCSGLVGINLFCDHLGIASDDKNAVCKVTEHIEHYLSLGGENTVCFGCDFDGAQTPDILNTPNSLMLIAEELARQNYTQTIIDKLFWNNAKSFINKNFNDQNHKKGKKNEILQYKRYRKEKI